MKPAGGETGALLTGEQGSPIIEGLCPVGLTPLVRERVETDMEAEAGRETGQARIEQVQTPGRLGNPYGHVAA